MRRLSHPVASGIDAASLWLGAFEGWIGLAAAVFPLGPGLAAFAGPVKQGARRRADGEEE
jgi:hypothetical protein